MSVPEVSKRNSTKQKYRNLKNLYQALVIKNVAQGEAYVTQCEAYTDLVGKHQALQVQYDALVAKLAAMTISTPTLEAELDAKIPPEPMVKMEGEGAACFEGGGMTGKKRRVRVGSRQRKQRRASLSRKVTVVIPIDVLAEEDGC